MGGKKEADGVGGESGSDLERENNSSLFDDCNKKRR